MRKVPAIVTDIDGVLVRGKKMIPQTDLALAQVRRCLGELIKPSPLDIALNPNFTNMRLPFVCLTNGGGMLESTKAAQINKALGIDKNKSLRLDKTHFLLNFSPLRPIMHNLRSEMLLIGGSGKVLDIAADCGLQKYMTVNEYCSVYSDIAAPAEFIRTKRLNPDKIGSRFPKECRSADGKIDFKAVILLHDPTYWEDYIQVISNILRDKEEGLPIYVVNQDIVYADEFPLPRFGFGPFTEVLIDVYSKAFKGKKFTVQYYGKPTLNTYDYTERYLKDTYQLEISNYYMIGDNPRSDIKGGNNKGWETILVRSGVFQGENDEVDPAKHVVSNFFEAIKLIFDKENLAWSL